MSTHKSQIGTWMSKLAQSAYGTARLSSDNYRRIVSNDQNVIELSTAFEDNASYDTGSDVADDMWAITNDSGLTVPFDFCFQDIGYWLHLALGGYSVSGSGDPYTHVFTPQNMNTSRQLPQRTFGKKYGGLKILIMRDGVCTNLTITGGKVGRVKTSATVKGSGHYAEDPASYTQPSLESDRQWAYNQKASFVFDDGTNTQSYTCAIESWTFVIENPESDPGYRACSSYLVSDSPKSGAIRSEYLVGVRNYTLSFECRLLSGDRMRGWLKNGTDLTATITINGVTSIGHSMEIEHTKMRVIESAESIVGDYIGIKGTCKGLSSSGSIPLTITLINDVASYTS